MANLVNLLNYDQNWPASPRGDCVTDLRIVPNSANLTEFGTIRPVWASPTVGTVFPDREYRAAPCPALYSLSARTVPTGLIGQFWSILVISAKSTEFSGKVTKSVLFCRKVLILILMRVI